MKKNLAVDPEKCTGCRICELVCSMVKESNFNPKKARIKVHLVGIPEIPVPVLSRLCDECGGEPVCLKYCPVEAISFSENNPKPDKKRIILANEVAESWLKKYLKGRD
jgi:Fe-S-cluster-containing hydrogenase component 2